MNVLITGISGALARMLARRLADAGHHVIGLDRRPWPDAPPGVEMFEADMRKRPAEDVFRARRPEAVIHMATVSRGAPRLDERYRINLNGTRTVFDHCHAYGVRQAIFVGRHTIYGAAPDAPLYRTEAEPPLAIATFPELADLVAADLFAASSLWRWPELAASVLRLVYTLGPTRRGTLASFLGGERVPMVLGFDPLYQFMHDSDAVEALVLALSHELRGVFNVAGPTPIPLSELCLRTGRRTIRLPEWVLRRAIGRLGISTLPPDALDHIKHSVLVDDRAFRRATGFVHRYDELEAMAAFSCEPTEPAR